MVFGDEMLATGVYLFPNISLLYLQPFQIKGCSEMPCDDMKELASSSDRLPTDRPSSFNILYFLLGTKMIGLLQPSQYVM
jgi:hypothetical protein